MSALNHTKRLQWTLLIRCTAEKRCHVTQKVQVLESVRTHRRNSAWYAWYRLIRLSANMTTNILVLPALGCCLWCLDTADLVPGSEICPIKYRSNNLYFIGHWLTLTRSSAVVERSARRSLLVEILTYCCMNNAHRSRVKPEEHFQQLSRFIPLPVQFCT